MIPKPTKKNVCYVKLNPMQLEYLKIKYQSCPVQFSSVEEIGCCLDKYLVDNPAMKPLTTFSYSEQACNCTLQGSPAYAPPMIPTREELSVFLPIVLPNTVFRFGMNIPTSSTWQLTKGGVVEFRRLVKASFWMDCFKFIEECSVRGRISGKRVKREDALADFMLAHNIPMSEYYNMIRYERRERTRFMSEVEAKRDEMEEKSQSVLLYT